MTTHPTPAHTSPANAAWTATMSEDDLLTSVLDLCRVYDLRTLHIRMVEAAARALAEQTQPARHGQLCPVWKVKAQVDRCDCWILSNPQRDARVVLAATLSACEVEQHFWCERNGWHQSHRCPDSTKTRLVITTPAEVMSDVD